MNRIRQIIISICLALTVLVSTPVSAALPGYGTQLQSYVAAAATKDTMGGAVASASAPQCGILDGVTIVEFFAEYESIGGVQEYLKELNRNLLERNAMTIVRLYIPRTSGAVTETVSQGRGTLVLVPVNRTVDTATAYAEQTMSSHAVRRILARYPACGKMLRSVYRTVMWTGVFRLFEGQAWFEQVLRWQTSCMPEQTRRAIREVIRTYAPQYVMVHGQWLVDDEIVVQEARAAGIPVGTQLHGENGLLNDYFINRVTKQADHVAVISGKDIPPFFVENRDVEVLYNGVDTDFFDAHTVRDDSCTVTDQMTGTEITLRAADRIVTLPARVSDEKGHDDMIGIACRLREKIPDVRIIFAGPYGAKDEMMKKLTAMIAAHRLSDTITFVGGLNAEKLRTVYALSDVVVLPTKREGMGRVLIEAQAMGVPVVAYDVGGCSEAFIADEGPGQSGFLVAKNDTRAFARRVQQLLDDPALCRTFGANGRAFVEEMFAWDVIAAQVESVYARCIWGDDWRNAKRAGRAPGAAVRETGDSRRRIQAREGWRPMMKDQTIFRAA